MKKLLTILLCAVSFAAQAQNPCNVTIILTAPESAVAEKPATFSTEVRGAAANASLTYNWTLSAGTISSGQGTSVITVNTKGLTGGSTITATVEVGGLPRECANAASATAFIAEQPRATKPKPKSAAKHKSRK